MGSLSLRVLLQSSPSPFLRFLSLIVPPAPYLPVLALLIGASTWGIVWYPYRLLAHNGVGGELSALITYGIATVAALALFPRAPRVSRHGPGSSRTGGAA